MVFVKVLILMVVLVGVPCFGDEYVERLHQEKERLSIGLSQYNDLGIYTASGLDAELSFLDGFLFKEKYSNDLDELRSLGRGFLTFMEETEDVYYRLSVDDWFLAAELLLEIDDLISQKVAWGNLVMKIAICNRVFFWMFDYVDSQQGQVDSEILDRFLSMQKRLRKHYPSNTSMYYIALRHYGLKGGLQGEGYGLSLPYSEELGMLEKAIRVYIKGAKDVSEQIGEFYKIESAAKIGSYLDLYDYPIPWSVSQRTHYFSLSWNYYEYLATELKKTDGAFGTGISQDVLYAFLKKEYDSEGRFWMPRVAVKFVEKPEVYSKNYMAAVKKERGMSTLRKSKELNKKQKLIKGNKFSAVYLR